jgi:hypothetical protein
LLPKGPSAPSLLAPKPLLLDLGAAVGPEASKLPLRSRNGSPRRKYALEAFPNYAESRAEQWMVTRTSLAMIVEHMKDPNELRAALQAQKEGYEALIQKKGQTFGYINEFPSPWDGKFPLPEGPLRKEIDKATGILSSFDEAFPQFAAILRGEQ